LDRNLDTYNKYVNQYSDYSLGASEREILRLFRHQWSDCRMLDIGIGTGRSTFTFAAVVREYVGIDYAEGMIERAREILPERKDIAYELCDARDLSRFYDAPFDFVLFSQNGLDSVGHEDREKILTEVEKVLKPGGVFCFSSHSVNRFAFQRPLPAFQVHRPIKSLYYLAKRMLLNIRLRMHYEEESESEILASDWSILKTGDHDFQIDIYHVKPAFQLSILNRLGFHVDRVLDRKGNQVDAVQAPDAWLYYVCRKPDSEALPATSS